MVHDYLVVLFCMFSIKTFAARAIRGGEDIAGVAEGLGEHGRRDHREHRPAGEAHEDPAHDRPGGALGARTPVNNFE